VVVPRLAAEWGTELTQTLPGDSAGQAADPPRHLLIARMRVHRRGERRHVPREPLRQKQVALANL